TNLSIAKLFMAGLLPGLLLVVLFMTFIGIYALLRPGGGSGVPTSDAHVEHGGVVQIINDLLPFVVLIAVVLGSLYLGLATPTESAALGCVFAVCIGWIWGDMDRKVLLQVFRRTVRVSGAIMSIVFAAYIFSYSVALSGLGQTIATQIGALELSRWEFILLLFVF